MMASSSYLQLWNLISLMLIMMMIMVKSTVDADFDAPVVKSFQPSAWKPSHATSFYDDYSDQKTLGGACGYGNLITNGYGTDNAALSLVLFNDGYGCGQCFQIKCTQGKDCYSAVVTVTATDLCPPNWNQDPKDGDWCNPPRTHFDMAKSAFDKITFWRAGIVPVLYRRVACIRPGGLRFSIQGNRFWIYVYVMNVGGAGDIATVFVMGLINTGWIRMSHNGGASYKAFGELGGQPLSFMVTSYTTKETIIASNVAPWYWTFGTTYQSTVNFHS